MVRKPFVMPGDLMHLFSFVITRLGWGLGPLTSLMVGSVVSQLGGAWGIWVWDTVFLWATGAKAAFLGPQGKPGEHSMAVMGVTVFLRLERAVWAWRGTDSSEAL